MKFSENSCHKNTSSRRYTAKEVNDVQIDQDAEIKTKYDDFSVDELKAALKNIFFYRGEFSDADMEEMNQIMAALDKKEPISPMYSAEESLKRFQETYEEELSSLGVRNTGEVMAEIPAADSDVVSTGSKAETVRPTRVRKLLRTAVFAAAIIVILVAIAATASALGYNLFGWIPKWNKDVLGFGGEEETIPNEFHDSFKIPEALELLGIDEPVYPHWLPKGFKLEAAVVETDPTFLHEGYLDGNRSLTITIQPSSSTETIVFEKDASPVEEYMKSNVIHYILTDDNQVTVTWHTDNYIVYITGDVSNEEAERMIDSVYEVK